MVLALIHDEDWCHHYDLLSSWFCLDGTHFPEGILTICWGQQVYLLSWGTVHTHTFPQLPTKIPASLFLFQGKTVPSLSSLFLGWFCSPLTLLISFLQTHSLWTFLLVKTVCSCSAVHVAALFMWAVHSSFAGWHLSCWLRCQPCVISSSNCSISARFSFLPCVHLSGLCFYLWLQRSRGSHKQFFSVYLNTQVLVFAAVVWKRRYSSEDKPRAWNLESQCHAPGPEGEVWTETLSLVLVCTGRTCINIIHVYRI